MYPFRNDYSYSAHPAVLSAIAACGGAPYIGYGQDGHCEHAARLIRETFHCPNAMVEFCIGGTQVNLLTIAALLRPWEGVICADSGHINGHEAGAVEAAGHKLLPVPAAPCGKLTVEAIAPLVDAHRDPHLVKPALVYISQATELGAVYTKNELTALSRFCHENGLKLFADGARLGCAFAADNCDLSPADLAALADAFTVGGTKNGALFGEALVFSDGSLCPDFFRIKKQRGGVLAKGFLLGAQFEALFTDGLYWNIARHAVKLAGKLQDSLTALGVPLLCSSPTNQIFPVVADELLPALRKLAEFEVWSKPDDTHTAVRFVTCFATTEADVDGLLSALRLLFRKGG